MKIEYARKDADWLEAEPDTTYYVCVLDERGDPVLADVVAGLESARRVASVAAARLHCACVCGDCGRPPRCCECLEPAEQEAEAA